MSPFICSFQNNMTYWVSSLISQQDGRLRTAAQQATQGKLRQEQLAQTVAQSAPSSSPTSRAQLAHKDAQLEQKNCQHTCVCSAAKLQTGSPEWSAKRNKPYAENPQKKLTEPLKYKKPWTNSFKQDGDKQKQNSETCVSPTALKHKLSRYDSEKVNWNTATYSK